jgi:VWFA-related protein
MREEFPKRLILMSQMRLDVLLLVFWIFVAADPLAAQQPAASGASHQEPNDPQLEHRPPPKPQGAPGAITAEGQIRFDIVVTDAAGKPVAGLEPWDFKLLDDNQPRKILSFKAFDGAAVKPEPPVEVILVLDMANLPFQQVAFVRSEVDQFLRAHEGHLGQPVTIAQLTSAGIRIQPRPSVDGNALAGLVDQIKGGISTVNSAMGGEGFVERFQTSIRALSSLAENEARKPGRKLLIWIGPGWPMLERPKEGSPDRAQSLNFAGIVELSTRLREARMVLYSVAPAGTPYSFAYRDFLKGVQSPRQVSSGNLALKVLVTQTGGQILGPDNDLAAQIDRCIADANVFYRISFNPQPAQHSDEYHDLSVQVDKPGVTVRTNTGYYNQPNGNRE